MGRAYATRDTDGSGYIEENATILRFDDHEAAEKYLRDQYDPDEMENGTTVSIETGRFGDYWVRTPNMPKVGEEWMSPFSRTQLHVLKPGQHPGGEVHWTTPVPEIMVAVLSRP